MPYIDVNDVRVVFSSRKRPELLVLEGVNLSIEKGEFLTIVGPSGCGKSTFLKVLGGLLRPESGAVRIDGKPIAGPGDDRAMVFQEFGLLPWRTVVENVVLGLELRGAPEDERRERGLRLIKAVGLEGFEDSYPHELSGGMKQRVGIARALAVDPDILLMDEPFASVDAQTRELMQMDILRLWEKEKKTVLFVTHSIEEAIFLSDRIAVMTRRPARVKEEVRVNLRRPRDYEMRASTTFNELRLRIWHVLRDELAGSPVRGGVGMIE